MSQCNSNCHNGMHSSKCVEYDENNTVYELLLDISNRLKTVENNFIKGVDSKTLGVGKELLATVQKLVDINTSNTNTNNSSSTNLTVDLTCLVDTNVNSITQEQFNQLIVNKLCTIVGEINTLKTVINMYPNV